MSASQPVANHVPIFPVFMGYFPRFVWVVRAANFLIQPTLYWLQNIGGWVMRSYNIRCSQIKCLSGWAAPLLGTIFVGSTICCYTLLHSRLVGYITLKRIGDTFNGHLYSGRVMISIVLFAIFAIHKSGNMAIFPVFPYKILFYIFYTSVLLV